MASTDSPDLLTETRDGALWITFDRPDSFNALTAEMTVGLLDALRSAATDESVRVVVLTGAGSAFCAGADMAGASAQDRYDVRAVDAVNLVVTTMNDCDKPVVCGLNGIAAGVGMSFAIACDLVVAKESAGFTLAFTKLGLMPDGGATATVAASVGRHRAMRLALLSDVIGAREAFDMGLVSHLAADVDYAALLEKVVSRLAGGAPLAQAATKKAVNAATLGSLPGAFDRERAGQPVLLRTQDAAEGVRAFNERRRAEFSGA